MFWDDSASAAATFSQTASATPSFQFPATVAVLNATRDWPRYSRRFTELLADSEQYTVMDHMFPDDPDIVIISGSTSGVYEDADWIDMLIDRTRTYIDDGVPVLGLCFGQQIIGKALGADVVQMDRYEIGYKPIRMDNIPLFAGIDTVEYPFSTHQDKVVDLPDELEPIARTDVCVQGIRHREKPVYGVQFHPELTPAIAEKAIRTKDIDKERKKRLLAEVNQANFHRAKRVLRIFTNFSAIAEEHVT